MRLLKEGFWIAAGHALAAIATLIGVRVLTELAPPSLFGGFALLNGILALLQGVLIAPIAQAALRFYPEFAAAGSVPKLREYVTKILVKRWPVTA